MIERLVQSSADRTDPAGCVFRCPGCVEYEFTPDRFIIYDRNSAGIVATSAVYEFDRSTRRLTAQLEASYRGDTFHYDFYFSEDFRTIESGTLTEYNQRRGTKMRGFGDTRGDRGERGLIYTLG
jgi:hypothetical protein